MLPDKYCAFVNFNSKECAGRAMQGLQVQVLPININDQLNGSVKEPNISIYFFFLPVTQWCSISDVLFTGGRGVSDFSVLKYY